MTKQTEIKYNRMFEVFTGAKYDETFRIVALHNAKMNTQVSQDAMDVLEGNKMFTYQTKEGTATIRVNSRRKTIELNLLVNDGLSNKIKKVLEIN
ncbi:MAG: hypothetical protein AABX76_02500 [Nanoarchaeota archaeon]